MLIITPDKRFTNPSDRAVDHLLRRMALDGELNYFLVMSGLYDAALKAGAVMYNMDEREFAEMHKKSLAKTRNPYKEKCDDCERIDPDDIECNYCSNCKRVEPGNLPSNTDMAELLCRAIELLNGFGQEPGDVALLRRLEDFFVDVEETFPKFKWRQYGDVILGQTGRMLDDFTTEGCC